MQKLAVVAAVLGVLLLSTTAWAVVRETEVTITENGKPVDGATITLSEPKPTTQTGTSPPPKRRPVANTPTNSQGRTTVQYDDEDNRPGWVVDVTVRRKDGTSVTRRGVPLSALVSGAPLDVTPRPSTASGTPALPTPSPNLVIPGTDIPLIIGGYVRHLDSSIGDDAGLGVRVIAGDPYFLKFPTRVPVTGAQGEVMINKGTWWQTLGLSFARGSENSSVSEPNGGDQIGYVPGDPNLGAGANFGNTGSSASGSVSLTDISLIYKAMQPFNLKNGFAWGWGLTPEEERSAKMVGGVFTFNYRSLDYDGHLQRDADPNNVFVDVSHDLDTLRFTAGPAIYGERRLDHGWFLHGKADAQIGIMRSTLDTHEVSCLGCGGVNPNESTIRDSKTSFAWSAHAQAGIGYQFTPNLKLTLGAEAWIGNRHILDTRRNPTDGGTGIATSTETDYGVFGRLVYMSDARLKRDIAEVGRLPNGLALYRYRYLWSDTDYVGVMAQEAGKVVPDAVVRGADGFLRVDYSRLGTRLMTWDEWRGPAIAEMGAIAR